MINKLLYIIFLIYFTSSYGYDSLKQYFFSNIVIDNRIYETVRNINANYSKDFTDTSESLLKKYIEPSGISDITYKRFFGTLDTTQTSRYPSNMHGKYATDVTYPATGPRFMSSPEDIHSKYIHFTGKRKFFPCFTPTFSFLDTNTLVAPVFSQKYVIFTLIDPKTDKICDHIILPGRNLSIRNLIGNAKHYQFTNTDGGTYYDIYNNTVFIPIQNKEDKENYRQQICIIPTIDNSWNFTSMYFIDISATVGKDMEDSLKIGAITALTIDESGNIWMAFKNSFIGCLIPEKGDYKKGKLILVSTTENFETLEIVKKRYAHLANNISVSQLDTVINSIIASPRYSKLCEHIKKNTSFRKIERAKKQLYSGSKDIKRWNCEAKESILNELLALRDIHFESPSNKKNRNLYKFKKNDILQIHQLNEERIQNSITYGYGALFAVTNYALYGFTLQNDSIYSVWEKSNYNNTSDLVYENKFLKIPGHLNTGSGTTPTLFSNSGVKFVGITDNNFPYINLSIYPIYDSIKFRDKYISDTITKLQVLAGHKLSSNLNLFTAKGSACENSIVAVTLQDVPFSNGKKLLPTSYLIIGNTFGYNKALTPVEKNSVGGLTCYQLSYDTTIRNTEPFYTITKAWDNYTIDVKTATPKLAIDSSFGYIYAYKKDPIIPTIKNDKKWWQLAAIDFATGLERFSYTMIPDMRKFKKQEPFGQFFKLWMNFRFKTKYQIFNNIWGTYTFVGSNKIYIGTVRGILIIQN